MHSLSPYLIRCHDVKLPGDLDKRYAPLDAIGQLDTFELLKKFVESKSSENTKIEDDKIVYKFSEFVFNDDKRIAYGWLNSGTYGVKNDIVHIDTWNVDFVKEPLNAEIINHFLYFYMPRGMNEAIALLHSYRSHGIKTMFHTQFGNYFSDAAKLTLQMNPLSYDKALEHWINGEAKEIRLIKFDAVKDDVADQISKLGHDELELKLKPPRRGTLGKLKDYFDKNSEQAKAVEIASSYCERVKTVIEVDGKKRSFYVGASPDHSLCEIEAPDTLPMTHGNPTYDGMLEWCSEIAREYAQTMYQGIPADLLP